MRLKSGIGPDNDSHLLQKYFKQAGTDHQPEHNAEDPQANGLAEGFMKI